MAKFYVASSEEYRVDNLNSLTRKELEKLVKRTAAAANARLARLEKFSKKKSKELGVQIDLENYGAYMYAKKKTEGRPSVRFRTGSAGKTNAELKREYQNALYFLSLKTSTVQDVTDSLMKQYESYVDTLKALTVSKDPKKAKRRGAKSGEAAVSFSQFYHDRERAWATNLKDLFDSDTIMVAFSLGEIGVLEALRDEAIARFERKNKRSPNPDELQTAVAILQTDRKYLQDNPRLKKVLQAVPRFRRKRK